MAAKKRNFSPDGVPMAEVAAYYPRRAEGGVGLLITEGTGIQRPAALSSGEFDLVAVGRALLHDWEWLRKIQAERTAELRDFDAKSFETLY